MSKQKASKSSSSSSSKLTKAELEALAIEFREELKKVGQEQQTLQEAAGKHFDELRTGLHRLEQIIEDQASRSNINEKQLQTVGEMAALLEQRLDKNSGIVEARPWEKLGQELHGALRKGLEQAQDAAKSAQADVSGLRGELPKVVQEAAQQTTKNASQEIARAVAEMERKVAELASRLPADRGPDIVDLGLRLDALEQEKDDRVQRLAALEQDKAALEHKLTQLQAKLEQAAAAASAPSAAAVVPAAPKDNQDGKPEKSADEWLHQARLLWNGRRYTNPLAVVDCLTAALESEPDNPELFNERGLALADAGLTDKAVVDFSQAILLDPGLAQAFHNRGLQYMKLDNRDLACRDFRSAAALGNPRALRMAKETGYCGGSVLKKLFRGVID